MSMCRLDFLPSAQKIHFFFVLIDKQEIQWRALFEDLLPDENILTPPPGGVALG